jgi:4-phytase/acid phosphatase
MHVKLGALTMKRSFCALQLASSACLLWFSATARAQPYLKIDRVVMLMRHGIRPPTDAQPIPVKYSRMAWPAWSVAPGLLTPHGAKGIALLAAADRSYFIDARLLPAAGCPAPGQITVRASKVPRAVETAEAWSRNLLPGCNVTVQRPSPGAPDLLFHILDSDPPWFDGRRAYQDALAQPPSGGLAAQAKVLARQMRRMATVLGCSQPRCDLQTGVSTLVEQPHDRPKFKGPLDAASTASETFLLEYLDGKPMAEVGWGQVSRRKIEQLLIFNVTKFRYVDRPSYIAKAAAGPLARTILQQLQSASAARITLLAGHDTNIADLGGLLGLHWGVPTYLPDDVPPGSALGFELLSDSKGHQFVRAFFRSQTMDQLRNLEAPSSANQPYRQYLRIRGCDNGKSAVTCALPAFTRLVEARLR